MDIGGVIKKYRKENKLKQSELAEKLHVTPQAISSWEKNRTQPKMEMIEQMCSIFHCQKSDFMSETPMEFDTSDEFEYAWSETGGGVHPLELSESEYKLVVGYRILNNSDKALIRRVLRLLTYARLLKRDDL